MSNLVRTIWGALAFVGWLALGSGAAQAGVVLPVDPATRLPISGSTVTLSVFQNGSDVTSAWLPAPGQTVQLVVNGLASPAVSLVFDPTKAANPIANAALTTSAYPGVCTNSGSDTGPDFSLAGDSLTSNDCGGMAVIQATAGGATYTFVLPQDSDADGLPDIWEAQYCPATTPNCLVAAADIDTGSQIGDGIANFDEYRGFFVSGIHVRTHPQVKNLFVHIVNPQCVSGTKTSLLGGGAVTFATGDTLFGSMSTLISGTQIHRLGYAAGATNYTTDEWVDNFVSYSPSTNVVYTAAGAATDRQINKNARYAIANNAVQKGVRLIECLDTSVTSPVGTATFGSPNSSVSGNAIVFTQRIVNYIDGLIATGGSRQLRFSTFQNGAWTAYAAITRDALMAKAVQFYLAMEVGHAVYLTTFSATYGYHRAPGSGSNVDQGIVNKIDKSSSGFNKFQIPFLFNSTDQSGLKLKN